MTELIHGKLGFHEYVTSLLTCLSPVNAISTPRDYEYAPVRRPFLGLQPWNMPMYLALSWGVSKGKAGGGDLGNDIPVFCCDRGT